LRRAWALQGEQAHIAITGCNAKRVVFGAINLRTGHRGVLRRPNMEQAHFQAFLRLVREAYPGCPIALLLDEAPGHRAAKSQGIAAELDIALIWLPKQCAELNALEQLWRELKGHIAANYQYPTIEEHAAAAEQWIRSLTPTEALRQAGIRSKHFWLQSLINPSCYLLKSMGFCLTLTVKSPISLQGEPAHGRQNYHDVLPM
jgi:transposase